MSVYNNLAGKLSSNIYLVHLTNSNRQIEIKPLNIIRAPYLRIPRGWAVATGAYKTKVTKNTYYTGCT